MESNFDLHMHTHYSFDSLIHPKKLVRRARKMNLRAIAVTDHNTIRGAMAAQNEAKAEELLVVIGEEVTTELGDVIGLFLNNEIQSRRFGEVIEEIREQGGVVYLPHPYSSHTRLKQMDIYLFDVIEVHNGRKPEWQNQNSLTLAENYSIPGLGGSDTHILFELGGIYNTTMDSIESEEQLRSIICAGKSSIITKEMSKPFLPIVRATYYMSWLRSGNFSKFQQRGAALLQRSAERIIRK